MRMLYWPLRSPTSASKRFPGNAARSRSDVAASTRSSFRRADRSNPENALTRFPAAKSLVLVPIADDHCSELSEITRYVKRKSLTCGLYDFTAVGVGFTIPAVIQTVQSSGKDAEEIAGADRNKSRTPPCHACSCGIGRQGKQGKARRWVAASAAGKRNNLERRTVHGTRDTLESSKNEAIRSRMGRQQLDLTGGLGRQKY